MEDKQNNIMPLIGMGLIFMLLYFWMQTSVPPKTEQPATTDPTTTPAAAAPSTSNATAPAAVSTGVVDSNARQQLALRYGAFAAAAAGTEQIETLENDLLRVRFSTKGGRIKDVWLKKYSKINTDSAGNEFKVPLYLLEDEKNQFEYLIPAAGAMGGAVNTAELYFTPTKEGNTLTLRAPVTGGGYVEQVYTLKPDNYELDYRVGASGIQQISNGNWKLQWTNHLDKLEKNQAYERTMSSVYYKVNEKSPDYCDCRKDDVENLGDQPVRWFSHSNQFFNTSLVSKDFSFKNFVGQTHVLTDKDPDLKILRTTTELPVPNGNGSLNMMIYTGPNEFDRLRAYDIALQDIIPFGSSLFGTINRWVIHPIFEFLSLFISNKGIVIIILTLLVKLMVYPLTYRMVYSQARMSALKPQIEALRKKYGDDQQQVSVETMKLYSEFKVNPLGGCMPVLLQMPIWFALYRFFPAAIEFRQASFLWATDLSSYDVALKLPFMVPGFGGHISLFTLIWVATTIWYTWYSMRQMDSAMMNPAMKWMQYLMPVMFMFFFNTFASGLTAYLCFSNLLNVGQTVATKRFLIDEEKIKRQLEANRAKPKKTGGWREKFEQALKEQQRLQDEKNKKK